MFQHQNVWYTAFVQAALLEQVEEKRLRKAREIESKQAEDDADRVQVLKALAYERTRTAGRYGTTSNAAHAARTQRKSSSTRSPAFHCAFIMMQMNRS